MPLHHAYFYYYGKAHLSVGMYPYILERLKQGHNLFNCDKQLYKSLRQNHMKDNAEWKKIISLSFSKITGANAEVIAKKLDRLHRENKGEGSKSYIIVNVSQAIGLSSRHDFIQWDKLVSPALKLTKTWVSVMCLFDFEKYLTEKEKGGEQLFNKVKGHHTHRWKEHKLQKIHNSCLRHSIF